MNDYNKRKIREYMKINNMDEIETYISLVAHNLNEELIILKPFKIMIKWENYKLCFYKMSNKTKKYIKTEGFTINNCGDFFLNEEDCISDFNTKLYNLLNSIKLEESILNKKAKMLEDNFINTDYMIEKLSREN